MQPIITPKEMAAIDAAAPEPVGVLIERAGWALAREAIELLGGTYGRRVVVVAGKGNNGADGRSAARVLERRGIRCRIIDAASMAAGAEAVLPPADLVIDAAYGTGFRGDHAPARLGDPTTPVLACDIPSGVDGLTGLAHGNPWVATRTVTFAALKPGLLLGDGAALAGEVRIADIGLDTSSARSHRVTLNDLPTLIPSRQRSDHKWRHAVWVIAGSFGMAGAAHLTARAVQRAGAGYVRLSTPGQTVDPWAPTEVVVHPLSGAHWAADVVTELGRFAALAVGPGLGADQASDVARLVETTAVPMVLDADGLRALGDASAAGTLIRRRPANAGPVVLTPHDGEFAALTGAPPAADRFAAVRSLAAATGAVVLLKGPTTIVAQPSGEALAVDLGDERLATAGTGDVLTGIIAALLALGADGLVAAGAGAALHARSSALACRRGLVAGDLADHLPTALTELLGG